MFLFLSTCRENGKEGGDRKKISRRLCSFDVGKGKVRGGGCNLNLLKSHHSPRSVFVDGT